MSPLTLVDDRPPVIIIISEVLCRDTVMLTLQGHFIELVSKRNEVSQVKSVLQCQFKKPCLQAAPERHTHVWTNRDAS